MERTVNDRFQPVRPRERRDREDEVAKTVRLADPLYAMPPDTERRLRAVAIEAWERKLRQRDGQRRWRLLAAAAAIVALLLAVRVTPWWHGEGTATPLAVARVERVVGGAALFRVGDAIGRNDWLETGADGLMAVRASTGHSIRLASQSRARFTQPGQLELERGAVYMDSDLKGSAAAGIEIATPHGRVTELGTRFEVRVTDDRLRVRVREGRVETVRGGLRHEIGAGVELTLDALGNATRRAVSPYGEGWDWVLRAAPAPPIEGRPLSEFLDWIGRETGWTVEFGPTSTARSRNIVLHGSVDDLSPEAALQVVLPTCGMSYELRSDKLILHESAETPGG